MTPEAHTTYTNQTGEEEEEVGRKKTECEWTLWMIICKYRLTAGVDN